MRVCLSKWDRKSFMSYFSKISLRNRKQNCPVSQIFWDATKLPPLVSPRRMPRAPIALLSCENCTSGGREW